jgi:hypothetical protein
MSSPLENMASKKPLPSMKSLPSKKPKLDDFNVPGTLQIAICASQSASGLNTEFPVSINEVKGGVELFFGENAGILFSKPDIGDELKIILKDAGLKEELLRDAIYRELRVRHNVKFPDSTSASKEKQRRDCKGVDLGNFVLPKQGENSKKERGFPDSKTASEEMQTDDYKGENHGKLSMPKQGEIETRFPDSKPAQKTTSYEYKEADLANLLLELNTSMLKKGEEYEKERRILKGLPVTTTSRPDLTVMRKGTLVFGEVKNNAKYTKQHAWRQCTLYLCTLLYYFRVRLGKKVESVFGFYVCGCGCTSGKYKIGLIKLSAPSTLGAPILSQAFRGTYATGDMTGMELLVKFLKGGKACEFYEPAENDLDVVHRIPALLSLPVSFWEDPCLVTNGTRSIVFRGKQDDISRLLDNFEKLPKWDIFEHSVKRYFQKLLTGPESSRRQFYLKIRLIDFSSQLGLADPVNELLYCGPEQYKAMYCVEPFRYSFLAVYLMNDCGSSLTVSTFTDMDFKTFCNMFREFWEDTMVLCRTILHGDVLPHNIMLTNMKKLILIDCDEGTVRQPAFQRVVDNAKTVKYPYLRYPNFLREWENAKLYTQIQMLATFLAIIEVMTIKDPNDMTKIEVLRELASKSNDYLSEKNDTETLDFEDASEDEVKVLGDAIDALGKILGVCP